MNDFLKTEEMVHPEIKQNKLRKIADPCFFTFFYNVFVFNNKKVTGQFIFSV